MSALTDRNSNIASTMKPQEKQSAGGEENKPQEMQQHRDILEQKKAGSTDKQYVSPSDAILSPASQKLTSFKQRQINKSGAKNPAARTLFARTPSGASSGFDDVVEESEKKA